MASNKMFGLVDVKRWKKRKKWNHFWFVKSGIKLVKGDKKLIKIAEGKKS